MIISDTKINESSSWKLLILISLLLTLTTTAVYWQVQGFDFVNYDDGDYVSDNPQVQKGFTVNAIRWAMTTGEVSSNWHPLTLFSHILDWQLYGAWAGGHHLTNLFFHIANTLLLFLVFRKMTGDLWQSGFIAAVFALHPLHIQSVAWVSERKDVLSAFFWMLTLWAYAGYARRPGWTTYIWVVIFFILGLMSKPMVVTLPFVLLLLDFWPLQRLRLDGSGPMIIASTNASVGCGVYPRLKWEGVKPSPTMTEEMTKAESQNQLHLKIAGLIREKIPLFMLCATSAIITLHVQQKGGAVKSLDMAPLADRLANSLISYIHYILKTIYPKNLAAFYPYPDAFPWWKVTAAGVTLAAITWLAIRLMRGSPYVIVGWLWFLGTLVPVIGLVQVGAQSMADRYMYLPMVGLLIMTAWGIPEIISDWRHKKFWLNASAMIAILILSLITWKQTEYWKNSLVLWRHAINVTKNNHIAHYNLGGALDKTGDIDQAIFHYRESLAINPVQPEIYMSLGNALIKKKDEPQAQIYFQKAALLAPENEQAQYNLGTFLLKKGDFEAAIPYLEKAVRLDPENDQAQFNLAKAFFQKKDYESALIHAQKAIGLNPDHEKAHQIAGAIFFEQGNNEAARMHFNAVLSATPKSGEALHYMGVIFLKQKQIDKALASFKKAVEYDPKREDSLQLVRQLTAKLADMEARLIKELENDPDNSNLRKQLGKTYQMLGSSDRALKQYEQVLGQHPESIDVLYDLAAIHADQGDYSAAIVYMEQAMSHQPDNSSHAYNLACLYARQAKTGEALSWLGKALDKGYENWEQIRTDEDLKPIRDTVEFKRMIEKKK